MSNYGLVLFILTLMVIVSAFSDKVKIPYPVLLVLMGIGVGFVPNLPDIRISPEVVFLLFLPPLLYDAAFNLSFKQFATQFSTIRTLAFPLVFITACGIAVFVRFLIPGMTWPLAFTLGAILSATDAVAAIGITKNLGISHKTITILEGESLINDASALVAYHFAIAAIVGVTFVFWKAALQFVILLAGGLLVGLFVARFVSGLVLKYKSNEVVTVCFLLLAPFVTYLFAESIHVSGVIAVVSLGFGISRFSTILLSEKIKHQSKAIWEIIIFLLNGLIFILIGLQFPYVVKSIPTSELILYVVYATGIAISMIFLRFFWITLQKRHLQDLFVKTRSPKAEKALLDSETTMIVCWGGIRGIIPLALAISLPSTLADGTPFPNRDSIIVITVLVVTITLIGQGMILPYLVKKYVIQKK